MIERQPAFHSLRVLGLGDNVVDRYRHEGVMYPGGNALNFAAYAKLLGADASFVGTFGTDEGSRYLRDVLAALGIPTPHARIVEGEGGHADVNLLDGNREFLGSNRGGVARIHPPTLDSDALRTIANQRLVHTSCFSHIDERLGELRTVAPLLSYDLSSRWAEPSRLALIAKAVDAVVISLSEQGEDRVSSLTEQLASFGCRLSIFTMGGKGASIWSAETGLVRVSPSPTNIVDTLGAGDAFATAVMLKLLAAGWHRENPPTRAALTEAGVFGAGIAAAVCRTRGAFGFGAKLPGV